MSGALLDLAWVCFLPPNGVTFLQSKRGATDLHFTSFHIAFPIRLRLRTSM
jgi:hypothetical protein